MKTPKLIPIDLKKCCKCNDGDGDSWHPDIKTNCQYLALIDGQFHAGYFSKQWYGWNFEAGPWGAGLQLDKPGTNGSDWQRLWRIK